MSKLVTIRNFIPRSDKLFIVKAKERQDDKDFGEDPGGDDGGPPGGDPPPCDPPICDDGGGGTTDPCAEQGSFHMIDDFTGRTFSEVVTYEFDPLRFNNQGSNGTELEPLIQWTVIGTLVKSSFPKKIPTPLVKVLH